VNRSCGPFLAASDFLVGMTTLHSVQRAGIAHLSIEMDEESWAGEGEWPVGETAVKRCRSGEGRLSQKADARRTAVVGWPAERRSFVILRKDDR